MPRVSVVMAVYNGERFLREAVDSILTQTFTDLELIVVDDGSEDSSAQLLAAIEDPRVRIISHEVNKGAALSRNDGMQAARGEYIAIMDSDDIALPTRLEVQVRFLDSHTDIGLTGAAIYDNIDVDGSVLYTSYLPQDNETLQRTLIKEWCFLHPSIMFRSNVLAQVGGYREQFEPAEDHDFILRVLDHCKVTNLDDKLVSYRLNPRGLSVVGHDYIDAMGVAAMRLAEDRRHGRIEDVDSAVEKAREVKRRHKRAGIVARALYGVRASFYASNRYYGFGCRELYGGNYTNARRCFRRSIYANFLFWRSWACLVLSFLPVTAERLRFVFRSSMKEIDRQRRLVPQAAIGASHVGPGPTVCIPPTSDNVSGGTVPDLERRTAEGALVAVLFQGASLIMRTAAMIILARLLAPEDFGIVGMVIALTGFVGIVKEGGLADAAIQSSTVTNEQLSTLFWINAALGVAYTLLCAVSAPAVAAFYREPRLFWIMIVVGLSFLFTGLSAQHRAILVRHMRIRLLGLIDLTALMCSISVAIVLATAGFGYWALVANALVWPAGSAVGVWIATKWVPGPPRRNAGSRRMIAYGGTVTLYSIVIYVAYNAEKVLLGRFWGAEALGFYGRAYTLVNLPTENLQVTIGSVAFPALARVQGNPADLRGYFLRIYSSFLSIVLPIAVACVLFGDDIVRVFLGQRWNAATPVFRLLVPSILALSLIKPFYWLMLAIGHVDRALKISLAIAAVVIVAYVFGLSGGPSGVAAAFSVATLLLLVPIIVWAKQGTPITNQDVVRAIRYPAGAAVIAAGVCLVVSPWLSFSAPLARLTVNGTVLFGTYLTILLLVFGQHETYLKQLRQTGLLRAFGSAEAG